MARLGAEALEKLKAEVPLERLVELAGVELRPEDGDLVGSCPFHADEGTSLLVSPAQGTWRCPRCCAQGGTAIEWTMRAEGVSRPHAVELLRDGALPSAPGSGRAKRSTVAKLPPLSGAGAEERDLLSRVRLGYANRTLGYRLPARNRKAGAQLRGMLASNSGSRAMECSVPA